MDGQTDSHMELNILRGLPIYENINCSRLVVCRAKKVLAAAGWKVLLYSAAWEGDNRSHKNPMSGIKARGSK
jgi:hypothetical protein